MKLRCRLLDRGDRECTGEVMGLRGDNASLCFAVEFGPGEEVVLPLGEGVDLALFGPELYRPHLFRCTAIHRTSRNGREIYNFQVDPGQRWEFDQVVGGRSSIRVRPSEDEPVTAELCLWEAPSPIACPLLDVSMSGISAQVAWADEKLLVRARDLRVVIGLPGLTSEPTPIAGTVRRRAVEGERIVYGIAFDPEESTEVNPTLRALEGWIESRYLEVSGGGVRVQRRTG